MGYGMGRNLPKLPYNTFIDWLLLGNQLLSVAVVAENVIAGVLRSELVEGILYPLIIGSYVFAHMGALAWVFVSNDGLTEAQRRNLRVPQSEHEVTHARILFCTNNSFFSCRTSSTRLAQVSNLTAKSRSKLATSARAHHMCAWSRRLGGHTLVAHCAFPPWRLYSCYTLDDSGTTR